MYRMDKFNRHKEYLKYGIPFARIIGNKPAIVLNKDGSMQTSWLYRGPDLDSAIKEQLSIITQQLNAAFQSFSTNYVIYMEAQRTASTSYSTTNNFPDVITRAMDRERALFFSNGQHFESNYYFTLYWMPPSDNEGRMKEFVIEGKQKKDITADEHIDLFKIKVDKLINVFNLLRIPTQFLNKNDMLTYLHSTVSASHRQLKIPVKQELLDNYLCDSPLYGGLEPRLGNKHLRIITPVVYMNSTVFGEFDCLNQLNFEYRWISRFFCLSKQDAIATLDGVKKDWKKKMKSIATMVKELLFNQENNANINQNASQKFNEVKDAIHSVESDVTNFGYYSTAVVVMDEDIEAVEEKAKMVENKFINLGFKAKIEDLNAIDAWFGTIPGNVGRFIRKPLVSCGNLVHMAPISDIWAGNNTNKHLAGPPLLYTQTTGHTPFRLSLHVGDVGHTLIAGPTGAGKSVLLNILAASFRKYKDARVVIFDKGASSMVLTAGVGGQFFDLGNENEKISFQPLAHIDDEKDRQWVLDWLCDFINQSNLQVTPHMKSLLWDALNTVASYADSSDRRMTVLVNAVQSTELKTVLEPLTIAGAYGHIFDSDKDMLTISSWQTFEMEKLMQSKQIVSPTLMYIFHRIEQALNGEPTIIILDECWVFFDNEQFAQKIREWLKVLRKSNASVIFATQSLTDIVESPIFSTILESCSSQIFLPYDKALEESVKQKYLMFGLNQRQVEIIAAAVKKKQYYYVSQLGCRLYDLALEHCPLALAYVAVNKADTNYAAEIISKYGQENFNKKWMEYRNISLDNGGNKHEISNIHV